MTGDRLMTAGAPRDRSALKYVVALTCLGCNYSERLDPAALWQMGSVVVCANDLASFGEAGLEFLTTGGAPLEVYLDYGTGPWVTELAGTGQPEILTGVFPEMLRDWGSYVVGVWPTDDTELVCFRLESEEGVRHPLASVRAVRLDGTVLAEGPVSVSVGDPGSVKAVSLLVFLNSDGAGSGDVD